MNTLSIATLIAVGHAIGIWAELPRSAPEAQGVSSSAVLSFIEAAESDIDALHSFMLLRQGHVVAEGWWSPYHAESPHSLYSLSNSFTSTAVGLAISEGELSLEDEVLKFFPENAPSDPNNHLKAMRVHDLLRMSMGHQSEPPRTTDEPWTKTFLAHPVPFKPGTHFLYNTSGTYMLSAVVQKATGQTVLDYLRPRLFEPLGIVLPELDAVIAITSGVGNMQSVLDLVWDKLLPAMQDMPLAREDMARRKLEQRLQMLSLPVPQAAGSGRPVLGKTYTFPTNERKLETIRLWVLHFGHRDSNIQNLINI